MCVRMMDRREYTDFQCLDGYDCIIYDYATTEDIMKIFERYSFASDTLVHRLLMAGECVARGLHRQKYNVPNLSTNRCVAPENLESNLELERMMDFYESQFNTLFPETPEMRKLAFFNLLTYVRNTKTVVDDDFIVFALSQ